MKIQEQAIKIIDPLGQPTVTADRGSLLLHILSVHTFQNLAKQNKVKTMFATGETVDLTERIIDGL